MADLNDDLDRKGNRIDPQALRKDNQPGNVNERWNDPASRDREMSRDRERFEPERNRDRGSTEDGSE